MTRRALFLDRDGVINVDFGYVHAPAQCVFVEGIFDLVRAANAADMAVIVVTNQAGIGRGLYTGAQFETFMQWMRDAFVREGARLDRVYHCPHHPQAALANYRTSCACRKPQPGMLKAAREHFDLDMAASLMVGDRHSDMQAAARAGVGQRVLFAPRGELSSDATLHAGTLAAIVPLLLTSPRWQATPR